jgi:NifU-like protein
MAAMTLNGIQQRIMEELGQFIRVLPASEQQKQAAMGG